MKKIQTIIILLILTIFTSQIKAQNFDDLEFGTDHTLDIITWNTEWFPANGSTTVNYVADAVEAMDAEIIAFQEIDNKSRFQQLIDALDDYEGYYISNDDYQGLAYLYHKDRINVTSQYEILTSDWSEFPRAPLILEFEFEGKAYVVINNHLKCCGDGYLDQSDYDDEENRRYRACNMLDTYISYYFNNDRVILVGDLNDEITDSNQNNVFINLINADDEYLFADMEIAEGSSYNWSYPDWPSHLDHIMITNELFDVFNEQESTCETIKIDEYFSSWNSYENNISDHRPVGIKLQTQEIGLEEVQNSGFNLYPNPFQNNIAFLNQESYKEIKIYSSTGSLVYESELGLDNNSISTAKWPAGIYIVQLLKNQQESNYQKILKL